MSRVLFIEPKSPGFHIFSKFPLPRLGCFILGTIMKNNGWDVEIIIEESMPLHDASIKSADLVCVSTITPTAPRAYEIADSARKQGKTVLMGGPHATFMTEEAMVHADFVIRGEGERSLAAFARAWEAGSDYSAVPGLSYRKGNSIFHNPMDPVLKNLDELPIPDYELIQCAMREVTGYRIIPVQTSRGCPFDCSFCSVTGMFGRRYRYRSHDHVMRELVRYNDSKDFVFFYDDNFTANRARSSDLLKRMIEEGPGFPWSTQVRVDVAKEESLVKMMKQANCHTVFIGFESVNEKSLKGMKKSQTVGEIQRAIDVIKKNRIHIHGMFVFGFDEDTQETVEATIEFAKRAQLSSLQFLILTPLPGSKLYNDLDSQHRITTKEWSVYDTHHVVFEPKNFSAYDLQMAQISGHSRLFSIAEITKKLMHRNLIGTGLGVYARKLNKTWQKKNVKYLRELRQH